MGKTKADKVAQASQVADDLYASSIVPALRQLGVKRPKRKDLIAWFDKYSRKLNSDVRKSQRKVKLLRSDVRRLSEQCADLIVLLRSRQFVGEVYQNFQTVLKRRMAELEVAERFYKKLQLKMQLLEPMRDQLEWYRQLSAFVASNGGFTSSALNQYMRNVVSQKQQRNTVARLHQVNVAAVRVPHPAEEKGVVTKVPEPKAVTGLHEVSTVKAADAYAVEAKVTVSALVRIDQGEQEGVKTVSDRVERLIDYITQRIQEGSHCYNSKKYLSQPFGFAFTRDTKVEAAYQLLLRSLGLKSIYGNSDAKNYNDCVDALSQTRSCVAVMLFNRSRYSRLYEAVMGRDGCGGDPVQNVMGVILSESIRVEQLGADVRTQLWGLNRLLKEGGYTPCALLDGPDSSRDGLKPWRFARKSG